MVYVSRCLYCKWWSQGVTPGDGECFLAGFPPIETKFNDVCNSFMTVPDGLEPSTLAEEDSDNE